jgi:hypothetical protein
MLLALASGASATPPTPPFCQFWPQLCHRLVGERRAHYLGLLQEAIRAVPRVPGYRCRVAQTVIDDVGFGESERRAAPKRLFANLWCLQAPAHPGARKPDVVIDVELSTIPAIAENDAISDEEHHLVTYTAPNTRYLVFGKLRVWGNPPGVIAGCCSAETGKPLEAEIVNDGPYLLSTKVRIFSESPATVDAFARGFDRAAISTLMAREARRRRADPGSKPVWAVLPESTTP